MSWIHALFGPMDFGGLNAHARHGTVSRLVGTVRPPLFYAVSGNTMWRRTLLKARPSVAHATLGSQCKRVQEPRKKIRAVRTGHVADAGECFVSRVSRKRSQVSQQR